MIEFYTYDGISKKGPFSLEDIKNDNISKSTLIWKRGNKGWIEAKRIPELQEMFREVPPPLPENKKIGSSVVFTRFIMATIFALITKFVSYDLIVKNFGGHDQMENHDYSEAQTVSYFFAVMAFIAAAVIMRMVQKIK